MNLEKLLTQIETISEKKLLLWGVLGCLAASLIASLSYTHYDGVLDMHQSVTAIPFGIVLSEILINTASLTLVLWGAAAFWSTTSVSLPKLFLQQLVARIPFLFPPLLFLIPQLRNFLLDITKAWTGSGDFPEFSIGIILLILIMIVITIVALYVFIRISFHSFVSCGNLESKKVRISYIGALLMAEMISKWVIVALFIKQPLD